MYDSVRRRGILFGGMRIDGTTRRSLDDTWIWDGDAGSWTQALPATSPTPRYHAGMIYHGAQDRVLLFGGGYRQGNSTTELGDTWELDPGALEWRQISSSSAIPARVDHTMVYDTRRETALLYGGGSTSPRAGTWEWSYADPPPPSRQPGGGVAHSGQPVGLAAVGFSARPIHYQWRRDGVPLADGGRISGSRSSALFLSPANMADTGLYDAAIATECGTVYTEPALLSVVCYPNCDGSATPPALNVADFLCFMARFAAGDPYANCDGSTAAPAFNVNDFVCFQERFAAGCE